MGQDAIAGGGGMSAPKGADAPLIQAWIEMEICKAELEQAKEIRNLIIKNVRLAQQYYETAQKAYQLAQLQS